LKKTPKLYRLGDYHPDRKWTTNGIINGGVMAINSGQFRCPKKGEWFLSGAEALAYKSPNDLNQEYFIATLVKVNTTINYELEEISNE
jgi:hypothetical protein